MRTAGFTMLELTIVVLILGIVAVMGQPLLADSLTETRLDAAAAEIAAALMYARRLAESEAIDTRVEFKTNDETLEVFSRKLEPEDLAKIVTGASPVSEHDVEVNPGFSTVAHPIPPARDYLLDFEANYAYGEFDIEDADFGGDEEVEFYPDGRVSAGGTVVISQRGRQRTIAVDGLTGRISIS